MNKPPMDEQRYAMLERRIADLETELAKAQKRIAALEATAGRHARTVSLMEPIGPPSLRVASRSEVVRMIESVLKEHSSAAPERASAARKSDREKKGDA